MKRYCLFLFIIFTAALAFAAPDPYAHFLEYNAIDKTFFNKLISGEETTYMICLSEDSIRKYLDEEKINEIFLKALNNWVNKVKEKISTKNTQNEFEDILRILDNIKLKQVSCLGEEDYYDRYERFSEYNKEHNIALDKKADLILRFNPKLLENEKQLAFFDLYTGIISVNASNKYTDNNYVYYLSHELGHTFGLADQYSGQTYRGSFIYNSKVKRPSIMDKSKKITCDDVDGFITSIDRTLAKEREFYSLCNDGVFIKNGQAVTKEYQTYKFKENYKYFNANIEVSYDTGLPDSYIVDMTLKDFILAPYGIDFLKNMGFEVENLKTLKNVQIKIHGLITEPSGKTDFSKEFKTPVGLWTSVLYLKKGTKLEPKQVITRDYADNGYTVFTDWDKNSSYVVDEDLIVPMINFLPAKGYLLKEILRIRFFFRGEPVKQKNVTKRTITNRDITTPAEIDKNLQKTLNNSLKIDNL